ncbi:MAG: carbon dioxide concentrating mechanism protein CcmL [Planctomycetaceae bacterium]|nr:carbon dioxide concentrating mechanism protein CcmL [Planctomycetaceae bacterium]
MLELFRQIADTERMRIGKIIGQVTLSRCHPSVNGFSWRIAVPMTEEDLRQEKPDGSGIYSDEHVVVNDPLGVNDGGIIGFSEGAEASMPFYPESKPIDAYNAVILDAVILDGQDSCHQKSYFLPSS